MLFDKNEQVKLVAGPSYKSTSRGRVVAQAIIHVLI